MADWAHSPSDLDMLPGLQAGDPAVYELLYRRYYASLIDFAESFTHSTAAAEELVADVFVWIYEHRHDFTPTTSIRSYLFGAVRHRVLNSRRSQHREANRYERMHIQDDSAIVPAAPIPPDESLLEQEQVRRSRQAVARILETVSSRTRAILVFRLRDEMSYEEIGEVLGIAPESVRKQLYRTILSLRERFPEYLGGIVYEPGD